MNSNSNSNSSNKLHTKLLSLPLLVAVVVSLAVAAARVNSAVNKYAHQGRHFTAAGKRKHCIHLGDTFPTLFFVASYLFLSVCLLLFLF